jgi:hypothetical protein
MGCANRNAVRDMKEEVTALRCAPHMFTGNGNPGEPIELPPVPLQALLN